MSKIPSCADIPADKCPACQHSSLSLLLLRPSPTPKQGALAHPSVQRVKSDDALVSGLVPAIAESRYILRLLREGYVHMYIPAPPAGMKQWHSYRVGDQADLMSITNPACSMADISCSREGHNKMGYKLLNIPRAHEIGEVWLAFSANQWSTTLKAKNAANPKAMQQVNLSGGSPNTFKPMAATLEQKVMEFALSEREDRVQGEFLYAPLNSQPAEQMATELARVAKCHPKTTGHELAVVLRDPVGVAAELNAIRLRWHELAQQEVEKPDNLHPLNSSNALMGLKKVMFDANDMDSYQKVSPLITRVEFEKTKSQLPEGSEWVPLESEERQAFVSTTTETNFLAKAFLAPANVYFRVVDLGRTVYPDHHERARAWVTKKTEELWAKLSPYYDESARAQWISNFEARMQQQFYRPLEQLELDWLKAITSELTHRYFTEHFDSSDPNTVSARHSPGSVYAAEAERIYQPQPLTHGKVLDDYLTLFDEPVTDLTAVPLRAMLGNQQSFIDQVHQMLTGDPGKDVAESGGLRDKTYDLLKGWAEKKNAFKHHSWMGEGLTRFSLGQMSAFTGALMTLAWQQQQAGVIKQKLTEQIARAQHWWGVQQAVEWVVGSALGSAHPQAAKLPVLIAMRVDIDNALSILKARKDGVGVSRSYLKRIRKQYGDKAKVTLTLLTDTDTLKAAKGDLDTVARSSPGSEVTMGKATQGVAATAGAAVLTEEQFLKLYAKHAAQGTQAAQMLKNALTQAGADIRSIATQLDGRLAIGSIYVQALGLFNSLTALERATSKQDAAAIKDAWYGVLDGSAGVAGGAFEMFAVAASARAMARGGEQALKQSVPYGGLRFAVGIAGAAGGAVNMVACWGKGSEAEKQNDLWVMRLYETAAIGWAGTGVVSLLMGSGALAEVLAARGIGGAAMRLFAIRFGAAGTASVLGVSVTGWGLVLLGVGMTAQSFATAMTPTPIQRWISRSYFGKDSVMGISYQRGDKFTKGNWSAELQGLNEAIKEAANPEGTAEKKTEAKAVS